MDGWDRLRWRLGDQTRLGGLWASQPIRARSGHRQIIQSRFQAKGPERRLDLLSATPTTSWLCRLRRGPRRGAIKPPGELSFSGLEHVRHRLILG